MSLKFLKIWKYTFWHALSVGKSDSNSLWSLDRSVSIVLRVNHFLTTLRFTASWNKKPLGRKWFIIPGLAVSGNLFKKWKRFSINIKFLCLDLYLSWSYIRRNNNV